MIIARHSLESLENCTTEQPVMRTLTGYGRKLPTHRMVKLPGSPRWRRVYCCIFSNAGTCYVEDKDKNWIVIY
jgi:hypothetical protein